MNQYLKTVPDQRYQTPRPDPVTKQIVDIDKLRGDALLIAQAVDLLPTNGRNIAILVHARSLAALLLAIDEPELDRAAKEGKNV